MIPNCTSQKIDRNAEQSVKNIANKKENISKEANSGSKPAQFLFKFNNYTRKTGKNIPLLHNISFELPKGKLIALMGLSGEGKSTLFESMSGRCSSSHKTYGEVCIYKKDGSLVKRNAEEWVKRVNYHMQEVTQYRNIPVHSLLCSIARCYGKDKKIVENLLVHFRVSKAKHTLFSKLSGGEQKRIMTIVGIISEKELNLWDEPLTGLDSEIAKKTLRFMKNSRTTNVVSVHQPSIEIMNMFDWVIFMHSSTVLYSGPYTGMQEYFQQRGIEFNENILFIDYLMRLSADNPENPTDRENIAKLSRLTQEILSRREGERGEDNVFLTNSYSVNFIRVKEILNRSLYFDKGFKGSSILYEIIYYTFWLFVLMLGCIILEKTIMSYSNGFLKKMFFDPIYTIIDILDSQEFSSSSDYIETLKECLTTVVNAKWVSGAIYFFQTERALTFISMVSLFSNLTNTDYYRLCKINITEGQFTVGDFLVAQTIEICSRKIPMAFFFSTVSYYLLYSSFVEDDIKAYFVPNMLDIVLVSAVSSFVMGLYVLAIHMMPVSSKVYMYVGTAVLLLTQSIILQLESLSGFLDSNAAALINDMMKGEVDLNKLSMKKIAREHHPFYDLRISMLQKKPCFLDGLVADEIETEGLQFKHFLLSVFSYVLKTFYQLGPFAINEELLTKMRLYRETIYSVEGAESLARYIDSKSTLSLSMDIIQEIEKKRGIMYIGDMEKELNMHELLDPSSLIDKVTLGSIAMSVLRVLIPPVCILAVTGAFKYRQLQPKIRN
ncbi:hypothetical protein NEMIN01_0761 [Nematocida minor]|uniref:uncharacterized protein n=1 Tax=Nematocida minor TaxID=1912983 RepID=UPI00221E6888|nr:uncharacterized protein NEMIN01_0761 [Nematocida minor]KAI5189898.1 hypothetical protein NEMIN01_0761 [Nematocida minor]